MINEKLLISYLKKQKREYNEQVVILQKELTSSLMYNHKRDYLIKNLMYESIIHTIRIYENLIERIESGEFDVVEDPKKGGDNMSDRYTVINKEEPHGQSVAENGIPCTARYSVTTLNRLTQENHRLSVRIQGVNELLNDLFKELDENYAKASKSKKEIDIACAYAQLQLITEIIDEVERI